MKFLLVSLLSTLASVTGQLTEPPEMVVYFVNEQANATVCNSSELAYISNAMLPDLDSTLLANNFEAPDWEVSDNNDDDRRKLTSSNCDFCRRYYTASLCKAMFNCRIRRQLRKLDEDSDDDDLGSELLEDCEESIAALSTNTALSLSCQAAISDATCHVEFV
ncbi:hypothetical protein FisN_25Lh035 [Fistulifera solaris]|uniref:Saposin B-type domain-containing protein n=1 Tax=Fistulifera solaris TaxID=1519565 RepID=A0A1Z5JLW8_FISSO|nr:hypothetical protein FisN_25Lh035 [Fistulifera solaris]|eukprot:GAX14771.1 hypothetical protein FisN_25Lh035 [Fistulifera solaris]